MTTRIVYVAADEALQADLDSANDAYCKADPILTFHPTHEDTVAALMAAWHFIGQVPNAKTSQPERYRKADHSFSEVDPVTRPNASTGEVLQALLDVWDLIEELTTQHVAEV